MNVDRCCRLLAERSLFREMGSGIRDKREHFSATDLFFWFLIVVGIFVALGIAARILGRYDKHRLYNSPRALYRALCRAHQLDRSARRLIGQIAQAQGVQQPAQLFLEPARWTAGRLGPAFRDRQASIDALAGKIFARSEAPQMPAS